MGVVRREGVYPYLEIIGMGGDGDGTRLGHFPKRWWLPRGSRRGATSVASRLRTYRKVWGRDGGRMVRRCKGGGTGRGGVGGEGGMKGFEVVRVVSGIGRGDRESTMNTR